MKTVNVMISRNLGGIEQAFLDYGNALKMYNHQVFAVIDSGCKIQAQLEALQPDKIIRIPFVHYNYLLIFYLYFKLKSYAPDVIIVHNKKAIPIFKAVARMLNAKIIIRNISRLISVTEFLRLRGIKKKFFPTKDFRATIFLWCLT